VSITAFLAELRSRDIQLWAEGDRLRCNAPAGALTPELRQQLRDRKADILEFLRTAEAIAQQQRAIVPMQPHGTRIPVFAIPGHNGDIFAYRDLARHLGEDQPFFGMHPPGLDGHSEPLTSVKDIAAYFAAQIQAFQSKGPCIIAGYCAGGAVAFELAQQLVKRGAPVSFLALFGCVYPTSLRLLSRLPHWGRRVIMHARAVAKLSSFGERRQYLAERLRMRIKHARIASSPVGTDPVSLMKFRFEQAHAKAVCSYTPRRFSGRVCLILPNREWLRSDYAPLAWRSVAPHAEEYYGPDSVDPDRMLIDPDAPVFAEFFRRCRDGDAMGRSVRTDTDAAQCGLTPSQPLRTRA
jgi:thioesterase domain-containing protein